MTVPNAELIQLLEDMKPPKSKNIWRMITCKPYIPDEYVWMIWNLPGHGLRHKYQQTSIEE